jgi:hypothetical protein
VDLETSRDSVGGWLCEDSERKGDRLGTNPGFLALGLDSIGDFQPSHKVKEERQIEKTIEI